MAAKWTANRIVDQAGRTAVVTGANSGLGLVTALELARHGARVILACRNPERGEKALDAIDAQVPTRTPRSPRSISSPTGAPSPPGSASADRVDLWSTTRA
jgi:NAD(P)-dependent dehydrogenase (short-subunit alcohol dehydrogenase family)